MWLVTTEALVARTGKFWGENEIQWASRKFQFLGRAH